MPSMNNVAEIVGMGLTVWATCPECMHARRLDLEALEAARPGLTVPTLKAGLRCEACGHRGAEVSIGIIT